MHRILAPLLAVACVGGPAPAPALRHVPLPEPRHGQRVEAVGGGLLVFGGSGGGAGDRATFWLGPGAEHWVRRADMHRGRSFGGSAVVDGVAYAIGGDVERYDAAADRWDVLPTGDVLPLSHFAAVALGDRLFVLGGYPLERSGAYWVDVASGAVRTAVPPPGFEPGDHFHCVGVLDGELHVAGGVDVATFQPQRAHHVVRDGTWCELPVPPDGLWTKFGGTAVLDGAWFVFTGNAGARFTPGTGWQPTPAWPDLVAVPGVAAVGSELWSLGGMAVDGSRGPRLWWSEPARGDAWHEATARSADGNRPR